MTHPLVKDVLLKDRKGTPDSGKGAGPTRGTDEETVVREDDSGGRGVFVCAACGHRITAPSAEIKVAGTHRHRRVNPLGIGYEFGCFSLAPGCLQTSKPTTFFSWFRGYAWEIDDCSECLAHLGWCFTSASHAFHALLLDRIQWTEDA